MKKIAFYEDLEIECLSDKELGITNGGSLFSKIVTYTKAFTQVEGYIVNNLVAGIKEGFGEGFIQMTKNNPLN